jgi:hypothetical protein
LVEAFYQRLSLRAATIDELLSDAFEVSPEMTADADLAAQRMAAWQRACAAGDASLFARRLMRDGLSQVDIESRLAPPAPRRGAISAMDGRRHLDRTDIEGNRPGRA